MNYTLVDSPIFQIDECFVIGLFSDFSRDQLSNFFTDEQQRLLELLFKKLTKPGSSIWQAQVGNISVMLIHCGEKNNFDIVNLRDRINDVALDLLKSRFKDVTICLPPLFQSSRINANPNWQLQQMILQFDAFFYLPNTFKTRDTEVPTIETIQFMLSGADTATLTSSSTIAESVTFARRMADLPANVCTPSYLGEQARYLAKQHKSINVKIRELKDIHKLGMGAFIAVAQGSTEPPRFIEISYSSNNAKNPPIVLVGKGVTFDSGGISLKPAALMDEMKYDMSGAATVLGVIKAAAIMQLPLNIIGLIGATENMPSGSAVKPGDIVTSMSGQTIEIINTDAEGRLILADLLTFAERFNPSLVIDIATLTGAMCVALGSVYTGFMTLDDEAALQLLTAAEESGDKAWRMPLDVCYEEALKSPLADLVNSSFDRNAGAITAAIFLSHFTKKYRWIHLDIAGTAWVSGKERMSTGRPVRLLMQLLNMLCHAR